MDICVGTGGGNGDDTGEQLIYIALPLRALRINLPLFVEKREPEQLLAPPLVSSPGDSAPSWAPCEAAAASAVGSPGLGCGGSKNPARALSPPSPTLYLGKTRV